MRHLLTILALLIPAAAWAQTPPPAATATTADAPPALPTRDVDVTYQTTPGGPSSGLVVEQRSRFSTAAQRTRLDMPTPGLFSIMDYRTHTMSVVSQADRKVLETHGAPAGQGAYIRRGQDQVAGLPCTEWEIPDNVGRPALTCFTADGVMLRARRGTQVLAIATRVTYAPQSPDLFTIPQDFDRISSPSPARGRGPG